MKKIDKDSDNNLIKRSAYALAESTVSSTPGLAQAWALSKALYGNALEIRQQRALDWVEAISSNPTAFNKQLVESEEFQDGFVFALESYIRLRSFLKRRIALKVFKDFAVSDNKVEFQLERFNDTLLKISTASIKSLAFIKEAVLPMREQGIKVKLAEPSIRGEKSYERWRKRTLKSEPCSIYFDQWITDRYSVNSKKMKDEHNNGEEISDHNLIVKLSDIERDVRDKMNAPLAELEFLGLVKWGMQPENIGWSSTGASSWGLTNFAYEFIKFIEESPKET